ncbi:hypothetical protein H5395_14095 [Paracoccus sp. MC1854]|uniref:hypothetical protein n=1 Tax=Paracoccus sp. MC1854 TaxID=2760306 RepID=UPI0015FEEEE4|nr:hypothetical protein [Paracoccus sp. MC1854]MBB1492643.1 hypothetical protein [Paracoccus sp. MC1854]
MIVILIAIVTGSFLGALLAWMHIASALAMVLGYVAGGWVGLLLALVYLKLRSGPDDRTPECKRSGPEPREAWMAPLPGAVAALRRTSG